MWKKEKLQFLLFPVLPIDLYSTHVKTMACLEKGKALLNMT